MKNIIKSIALLALAAGFVSCSNAAKFETCAFVSFSGTKYRVREDAGEIKIPVNLVSDKDLTTTVTYTITSKSTAEEGKHYTMPNNTGVITISTDPAKCDSIVICPIDSTGIITNNKTLLIKLAAVVDDGIYLGATDSCKLTILDIDGGLFKMLGDWSGEVADDYYGSIGVSWSIEDCEEGESAAFPNANLKITTGSIMSDKDNLKTQRDVYCYFDTDKSELQIYPAQLWLYDLGKLNDGTLVSVSLDLMTTMTGTPTNVTLALNDGTLTFNEQTYFALWSKDEAGEADLCKSYYGYIESGGVLRKND